MRAIFKATAEADCASELKRLQVILATLTGRHLEVAHINCDAWEVRGHKAYLGGSGGEAVIDQTGRYAQYAPPWNPSGATRRASWPLEEAFNKVADLHVFERGNRAFGVLRTGLWYEILTVVDGRFQRIPYSYSCWHFEGGKGQPITASIQYEQDWAVIRRVSVVEAGVVRPRLWGFPTSYNRLPNAEVPDSIKSRALQILEQPSRFSIHSVIVGRRHGVVRCEGESFHWRGCDGLLECAPNQEHIKEVQAEAVTLAAM